MAIVLITPITVFAIVHWMELKWSSLPVFKGENYTLVDFQMKNQDGRTISLNDWNDKIVVVDFFFTHCTSICPKLTHSLKQVQAAYATDRQLLLNSFSVDPLRDSVERLQAYTSQFGIGGNWHLLTGNKMDIYRLARKSFSVVATDGDGGSQDFIHTEKLVLIDTHKRIRGYYSGTSDSDVQQLITDIKKIKNED
ncbi:MAG TPA: SCO family protein [Flavisolibacter sp.]|nr:SCO family protein [Flavisolibacter sp.]